MIIKKNIQNNLIYLTSVFFVFFLISNLEKYPGNNFLFIIFNIVSFVFYVFIIKRKLSSFEFFFYFFLFLSFWFKYSCILYFEDITVTEGDVDISRSNFDKATIVIIFSFSTCILTNLFNTNILKNFNNNKKTEFNYSFITFYSKYRKYILLIFICFLIIIWLFNFKFKIYSKGIVNQEVPTYLKYFFSWSFTYGLSIITSILIYIDFLIFKNKKLFVLGILETLFTNMTIYSRSFVISILAYLRGYYFLIKIEGIELSYSFILKIISYLIILSLLFFLMINELRNFNFKKNDNYVPVKLETTFNEFIHLSVNRWVGIDALLAVSQSKDLSFKLLNESLMEKKKIREKSFYIHNFFKKFNYDNKQKENLNIVITPGLIPYLYYSGSIFFVCVLLALVILFCTFIEKIFFIFSEKNIILSNIIGYALAVRFIHFGYVPYNTINFLISFIITFLGIYFLNKIIKKK